MNSIDAEWIVQQRKRIVLQRMPALIIAHLQHRCKSLYPCAFQRYCYLLHQRDAINAEVEYVQTGQTITGQRAEIDDHGAHAQASSQDR